MTMVKYSIRYNILPRENADGTHTVRARVSWDGKRVSACLANPVAESNWDDKLEMPKKGCGKLVTEIREISYAVTRLFDKCHVEMRVPTQREVKAMLTHKEMKHEGGNATLVDVMKAIGEDTEVAGAWSLNTRRNYNRVINMVSNWDRRITIAEFDKDAAEEFMQHCFARGLKNSTVMKCMKQMRWVVKTAASMGMCELTSASTFYPKYKVESENDVVYLTNDELSRLMSLDLSCNPHLERVRDVFVFCCFSGLRYSDAKNLRRDDIKNGCINVVTQKTSDPLKIELNAITDSILQKYKDECGTKALPALCNKKTNAHLKEIGKMAGLNQPVRKVWWVRQERFEEHVEKWTLLSSHCARRTFVVNALKLNISSEVIMKWTGHKDHHSMKPYVAIVDELKRSQMKKFDELTRYLDTNLTENVVKI